MKDYIHSTRQTEKENNEFCWDEYDLPVLEEESAVLCEGPITEAECFEAVMSMPNDKTPGSDGLSVNFYQVFWQELKDDLCQVFNKCFENGELCPSMRRGIITLLPKQGKDNLYLKNWRPISLLNTDYKILAKIIANRIKKGTSALNML